jgi:hypothetical protein
VKRFEGQLSGIFGTEVFLCRNVVGQENGDSKLRETIVILHKTILHDLFG